YPTSRQATSPTNRPIDPATAQCAGSIDCPAHPSHGPSVYSQFSSHTNWRECRYLYPSMDCRSLTASSLHMPSAVRELLYSPHEGLGPTMSRLYFPPG